MDNLFNNIYKGKKVLVTGHTGFKGSWLISWLEELGAEVTGFSLAPNTEPSHYSLIKGSWKSVIGDIRNASIINDTVDQIQPEIVFHLAAQPLVNRSYVNPLETFETNITGTINLYEAIRKVKSVKALVNVTTDKVYHNNEWIWGYRENDRLGGYDPYSTSKACVELVHDSYQKSFFKEVGIQCATARAGNVIGGGDWSEDRLIPDIVKAAHEKKETPIRNPQSVRPWQHVLDPLSGYLLLGQHLLEINEKVNEGWNFGPSIEDCLSVKEILTLFSKNWDEIKWKDLSDSKKLHETNLLRLDCSKAHQQLQWKPIWNIDEAIKNTALWYKDFYSNRKSITTEQLHQYVTDAKNQKAIWVK